MGKPIVEAEAEIEKCAWNCDFYAEHAATFLGDEHVESSATESYVAFEHSAWCWRSCPGTIPSGRWSAFAAAGPDGRQRRDPQARLERPTLRHRHPGSLRDGRLAQGLFGTVLVPGSASNA